MDLTFLLLLLSGLFIVLYYRKFSRYTPIAKGNYNTNLKNMGRTLPPHPNGWYVMCRSDELNNGQVKAIDYWGQNIALFRGTDGKAYALEAYCAHLGAHIGVGGAVKQGNCIQCPFHGWSYNGETGQCIDHNKQPIKGIAVEYNDSFGERGSKLDWKETQTSIKLRKYHVKEVNNLLYVWVHSNPETPPEYDIPDVGWKLKHMSYRGTSLNVIRCHLQDIAQNGADVMHFYYVHKYLARLLKFVVVNWKAWWQPGDKESLAQKFTHPAPTVDMWRRSVYDNLLKNNPDLQFYGVGSIDSHVSIPFTKEFFGWNISVVQVGPGTVFLFVKSYFFSIVYIQYVKTEGKFTQLLYHDIYTSWWTPYWLSALLLRAEMVQVYNDTLVWDAKQFKRKFHYQKTSRADEHLKQWTEWFARFYDGCKEKEQKSLQW